MKIIELGIDFVFPHLDITSIFLALLGNLASHLRRKLFLLKSKIFNVWTLFRHCLLLWKHFYLTIHAVTVAVSPAFIRAFLTFGSNESLK